MAPFDQATRDFMTKFAAEEGLVAKTLPAPSRAPLGSSHPITIFHRLSAEHEWHDWEPETIWRTFDIHDEKTKNLVMALQTSIRTNYPFEDWHIFEKVGHALNGGMVDFQIVQPLELEECALTLYLLMMLRPKQAFEGEIWGYIAARAKDEGIVYLPPDLFGQSQGELAKLGKDWSGVGREVAGAWAVYGKHSPVSKAAEIQLAHLQGIKAFVAERIKDG